MTTDRYLDFDLDISREGDRYMAEVRDSPAGPSEKVALRWPFGTEPHDMLLLKLENAILKARGYRSGGPLTSEEEILREFGSDVFRAVFRDSESVALKFAASLDKVQGMGDEVGGLRLKLRVTPPELAMLPWEYMFDASTRDADALQNYVCLRNRSPLVRFLNVAGPLTTLRVNGPLRVLGMIANPGDADWKPLDTEAERHRVEAAFTDIPKSVVHFEWVRGGSPDDLFDSMQQRSWHIFHFIGHGGTDRYIGDDGRSHGEGFLVMQNGLGGAVKVSASALGLLLEGTGSLRLAVLNCCDSGRGSSGVSSVGAALVANSGVPMAVAMQFAITNDAAVRFASMFYKSLISGQPVERALTVARRFMRGQSNVEWAIPVLFTRSGSCVLFEVQMRDTTEESTPRVAVASTPQSALKAQAMEELRRLFKT